jgi:hypothetical protein
MIFLARSEECEACERAYFIVGKEPRVRAFSNILLDLLLVLVK